MEIHNFQIANGISSTNNSKNLGASVAQIFSYPRVFSIIFKTWIWTEGSRPINKPGTNLSNRPEAEALRLVELRFQLTFSNPLLFLNPDAFLVGKRKRTYNIWDCPSLPRWLRINPERQILYSIGCYNCSVIILSMNIDLYLQNTNLQKL